MRALFGERTAEADRAAARVLAAKAGGGFADVFREAAFLTSLTLEDGRIEAASEREDAGVGLRIFTPAATATLAMAAPTAADVAEGAKKLAGGGKAIMGDFAFTPWAEPFSPIGKTLADKARLAFEIDRAVRALDRRVVQARVVYRDQARRILVTSGNLRQAEDAQIGFYLSVLVTVSDGKRTQTGFEALGGTCDWELFDETDPVQIALGAARKALSMLSARRAPKGRMAVVMAAKAGGTMIHEAVGHGLEADLFSEGHSIYGGRIGERVASPLVTVIDDPTLPGKRGSYRIDDEGAPSSRTVLIEDGVLKRLLHSAETALKTGLPPSANGRRESWRVSPIPRMSNTMIAPGSTDPAAVVRDTHRGLYVTKMGGGQVDTVSGDFVFEVDEGFLIENGAVGDPVRGATIAGNGPEALMAVDMVGSDLGFSIGTCGKDDQGAPVSDAQPTLRIPSLVVGG